MFGCSVCRMGRGKGKGGRGRSSELIPHLVHFLVPFATIFMLFYFLNEPFPVVMCSYTAYATCLTALWGDEVTLYLILLSPFATVSYFTQTIFLERIQQQHLVLLLPLWQTVFHCCLETVTGLILVSSPPSISV